VPNHAGTGFIMACKGRTAAVYLFFDKPETRHG